MSENIDQANDKCPTCGRSFRFRQMPDNWAGFTDSRKAEWLENNRIEHDDRGRDK